jgi:hypothetical protein
VISDAVLIAAASATMSRTLSKLRSPGIVLRARLAARSLALRDPRLAEFVGNASRQVFSRIVTCALTSR